MSCTGEQDREFGVDLLQRHLSVFGQDQEPLRAVGVLGLPSSLEGDLGTGETGKKEK